MARREQDDLLVGGWGRPDPVHLGGQLRLRGPEVELGERLERLREHRRVCADERAELVEDPADLLVDRRLRLAPRVAQLDDDERLHEQRLAAARRIVDDALHLAAGIGPHGHHVASVAHRDDRLLERTAELRPDERVESPAEAVVRDPHGTAQRPEPRRRRVQQLADRVEAARQRAAQRRQRVDAATEVAQQWPALLGERRLEARGGVERLGDLEELRRVEPAAPRRAPDPRLDVVRGTDPHPGPLLEQLARLVRLVEAAGDDDRVAGRLEVLGEPPRRVERRLLGESRPDLGELEQRDRARVHRLAHRARPLTDGLPATTNRHATDAQGSAA